MGNSETPGPGGHGVQWSRRKLTPPPRHSRPPLICAVHDPGAAEAKAERCPCGWSCRAPRPEALSPPLLVAGWSVSTESRCGEAPAPGQAGRGEARLGSRAPGAGARGRQARRARQRGVPRRWVGGGRELPGRAWPRRWPLWPWEAGRRSRQRAALPCAPDQSGGMRTGAGSQTSRLNQRTGRFIYVHVRLYRK